MNLTMNFVMQSWKDEVRAFNEAVPRLGYILVGDDNRAALNVKLTQGKEPFIFAIIKPHIVVGENPSWILESKPSKHGWKAVLLPKARDAMLKKYGIMETIFVKSLRVVKIVDNCLLCEVHQEIFI